MNENRRLVTVIKLRPILPVLLLWLSAGLSLTAAPILTLIPSTARSGPPGSTIGWGFTIQNDSNYIEITSAQFCLNPVISPACTPSTIGTFTDIISQFGNDIIVGPPGGTLPSSITEPYEFDALAQTGVGNLAIDPLAMAGTTDFGEIVLTYNLFDQDPNNGGNEIGTDLVMTANTSVTVSPATATPEPATSSLAGLALAALAMARRRFGK